MSKLVTSYERVRDWGEVFTPPFLVKLMLSEDATYFSDPSVTVMEPSCGSGNFLCEILRLRVGAGLSGRSQMLQAVATLYGVDIAEDNCGVCRQRMLEVAEGFAHGDVDFLYMCNVIIQRNIICIDFLDPPLGKDTIYCWGEFTATSVVASGYDFSTWLKFGDAAKPVCDIRVTAGGVCRSVDDVSL